MGTFAKNILVVEDNPLIALDLEEMLITAGHVVIGPAASVEEAMSLIDTNEVDCASLDFNLGDTTVTPVAIRLRAANVPFVFVTGNIGLMAEFANLPEAPLVPKPFSLPQLEAALSL